MELVKETNFKDVGQKTLILFSVAIFMLVVSLFVAIVSNSPSIYAFAATIAFVTSTLASGLIGFFLGRNKSHALSKISLVVTAILFVFGALLLVNSILLIYKGFKVGIKVSHFELAIPIPILFIIITYILSEYVERRIPELYWRTSRALGDRVRGIISSAGIALVGPTGAFFGVPALEPFFAIFVVLYGIVEGQRTVKEMLFFRRKDELLRSLGDVIERTFKEVPSIAIAKVNYLDVSGKFIAAELEGNVPEFVEERYIENIGDFMYIELINRLGTIVFLRVIVKTIKPEEVSVAIPLKDGETIGDFPSNKVRIITLSVKNGEIIKDYELDLDFDESEKIPYAKSIEKIAKEGVIYIIAKDFNEIAKNAIRHWFINEVKVGDESLQEALSKFKKEVLSL